MATRHYRILLKKATGFNHVDELRTASVYIRTNIEITGNNESRYKESGRGKGCNQDSCTIQAKEKINLWPRLSTKELGGEKSTWYWNENPEDYQGEDIRADEDQGGEAQPRASKFSARLEREERYLEAAASDGRISRL